MDCPPLGNRWFSYLNREGRDSLLNSIPGGKSYFIVCRVRKVEEGPRIYKKREYAAFRSSVEFYHHLQVHAEITEYHEVILGNAYQKPRFDIDLASDQTYGENIISLGHRIRNGLLTGIGLTLEQMKLAWNPASDVQIYTAHSDNIIESISTQEEAKFSCHIILSRYCHLDYKEAAEFARQVVANSNSDVQLAYRLGIVDPGIYKSTTNFRMIYSLKDGVRPKVPLFTYRFENQITSWGSVEDTFESKLNLFRASCLTDITDCSLLPVSVKPTKVYSDIELDGDYHQEIEGLLTEAKETAFTLDKVKGALILLKRKEPSYCRLCDRVHDNDHPFLRINELGNLYFYCRRAPQGENSFLLGTLEISAVNSSSWQKKTEEDLPSTESDDLSSDDSRPEEELPTFDKSPINWNLFEQMPVETMREQARAQIKPPARTWQSDISFEEIMESSKFSQIPVKNSASLWESIFDS